MSLINKEIKDIFNKYKLLSSFFLCLIPFFILYYSVDSKHRKGNKKNGNKIFVITHTIVINTVLFSVIFTFCSKYLKTVFNKLNISVNNELLMVFISGLAMSCVCSVIGGVAHIVVLKQNNIPIRDWASTDALENEVLCTGLITLFFTLILRMYYKLCSLRSNHLHDKKLEEKVINIGSGKNITGTIFKKSANNLSCPSKDILEGVLDQRTIKLKLKKLKERYSKIKAKLIKLSMKDFIKSKDPSLLKDMQRISTGFIELQEQFLKVEDCLKDLIKRKNNLKTIKDPKLLAESIFQLNKDCSICLEKEVVIEQSVKQVELMYEYQFIRAKSVGAEISGCDIKESITSLDNMLKKNLKHLVSSESEEYFTEVTVSRSIRCIMKEKLDNCVI